MKRHKKMNKVSILLLILLAVTIGYAAISTTLKINGTTSVTKQTWNIYWDNPVVTTGSVTDAVPIITQSETTAIWSVELGWPGEYYEFTIDAVNAGTIDAKIIDITPTTTPALPSFVTYTIKDSDGNPLAQNHTLPKAVNGTPTRETYTIRVEMDSETTPEQMDTITSGLEYKYSLSIKYGQAHYNASGSTDVDEKDECPGENCVYTFTTDYLYYGDENQSTLTNYTRDYRKVVKDHYRGSNGSTYTTLEECEQYEETCTRIIEKRRDLFPGFILDENNLIKRAFACKVFNIDTPNEKIACLEGAMDSGKYYLSNSKIIKKYYPNDYIENQNDIYKNYEGSGGGYEAYASTSGHVEFSAYDNYPIGCSIDYYVTCNE